MALCLNDGTQQKTLDIISRVVGVPVKYARIFSSYLTRDNHPGGAFTAMLDCYVTDNPDPEQRTPIHHEFGCSLPPSAIDEMSKTDNREVMYRHLEYIINYQELERNIQEGKTNEAQANIDLNALSKKLGIETLFKFQEKLEDAE